MTSATDFELTLAAMDDAALEASLSKRRVPEERTAVLRELIARRGVRRAAPILRRIARSATAVASMRTTAALALGKDLDPANQPALVAALGSDDDRVVRRAAEALGRIGDVRALEALRVARVPSAPAASRAHRFARSLIAYRLGLASDPVLSSLPVQQLGRGGQAIEAAPIPAALRKRLAEWLPEEAPGIEVEVAGGVRLDCRNSSWLVLPAKRAREAAELPAVSAVVLRRSGPLDRYALHLYLLTHRSGDRALALHGVRPDGTITHRGEIVLGKARHDFRLEALETPLSPAVAIEGQLGTDSPAITIVKARVGPRTRTPLTRPRVPGGGPAGFAPPGVGSSG